MSIRYLNPRSTKWAVAQISRIHTESGAYLRGLTLDDSPLAAPGVNITYGYLGYLINNISRSSTHSFPIFSNPLNLFILDHAYCPSILKGQVFRVSFGNSSLSPLHFHESLLSSSDKDLIYDHLTQLQQSSSISFSVPALSSPLVLKKGIHLFIKPSPVIRQLLPDSIHSLTNQWCSRHPIFRQNSKFITSRLISVKPSEVYLDPYNRIKSKAYSVIRIAPNYSDFASIACPASMMCIPFILNGIPVYLSDAHPLSGILGTFIPSLPKSESIDLVMHALLKTSASLSSFDRLEFILSNLSSSF